LASLYDRKLLFAFFSNQYILQEFRNIDKSIQRSQAAFLRVVVLARGRALTKAFLKKKKITLGSVVLTF